MPKKRGVLALETEQEAKKLAGVVACLTGIPQAEKDKLHNLIEKLGGSYTREFDPAKNTHLVAKEPSGAKFEVATQFSNDVKIVTPVWVKMSWKMQCRADEADYSLVSSQDDTDDLGDDSFRDAEEATLKQPNKMFASFHFFLTGWSDDDADLRRLSYAIRKSWGTIYWEFDLDRITHVVVRDHSIDDQTRNAALSRSSGPVIVSPKWIFNSLRDGELADVSTCLPMTSKKRETQQKPSTIFEDCRFRLEIDPPESGGIVMFDDQKLEGVITRCGGICGAGKGTSSLGMQTTYEVQYGKSVAKQPKPRTHGVVPLWALTCEAEGQFVSPKLHPQLFIASSATLVMHKFSKQSIRVSITGFQGPLRTAIVVMIGLMGGTYDDSLRTTTTHLVCGEPRGAKYDMARQNKIHVVSLKWLLHMAQNGKADEAAYSLHSTLT